MKVIVSLYASSYTGITLDKTGEDLYCKWQETDSDDDFATLADWILDDVATSVDIEIEDVEDAS